MSLNAVMKCSQLKSKYTPKRNTIILLGSCAFYNGYHNEKFCIKFIVAFNKLALQNVKSLYWYAGVVWLGKRGSTYLILKDKTD